MSKLVKHKSIFFHEDYYSQIELIPEENFFNLHRQIEKIPSISNTLGFDECIARKTEPVGIAERNISLEQFKDDITPLAISFSDNIKSGYSSSSYKISNCCVWGFNYYGIFVEYTHKNIVEKIWMWSNNSFSKNNSGKRLRDALWHLGHKHDLILVDWNRQHLLRFKNDINKLNDYILHQLDFTLKD